MKRTRAVLPPSGPSPQTGAPARGVAARPAPDPSGRVRLRGARRSEPRIDAYDEADLCAYAHHVWIQLGKPCAHEAWDEAKACLDANLAWAPSPPRPARR